MYAPIIEKADLYTLLHEQKINAITRDDDSKVTRAITAAITQVRMHLTRYDVVKMFGDPTNDIPATFADEYLTNLVKYIAVWNVCQLANVGVDLTVIRTNYEDAMSALRAIQQCKVAPEWPLMDNSTVDTTNSPVEVNSNRKRNNHY